MNAFIEKVLYAPRIKILTCCFISAPALQESPCLKALQPTAEGGSYHSYDWSAALCMPLRPFVVLVESPALLSTFTESFKKIKQINLLGTSLYLL